MQFAQLQYQANGYGGTVYGVDYYALIGAYSNFFSSHIVSTFAPF